MNKTRITAASIGTLAVAGLFAGAIAFANPGGEAPLPIPTSTSEPREVVEPTETPTPEATPTETPAPEVVDPAPAPAPQPKSEPAPPAPAPQPKSEPAPPAPAPAPPVKCPAGTVPGQVDGNGNESMCQTQCNDWIDTDGDGTAETCAAKP